MLEYEFENQNDNINLEVTHKPSKNYLQILKEKVFSINELKQKINSTKENIFLKTGVMFGLGSCVIGFPIILSILGQSSPLSRAVPLSCLLLLLIDLFICFFVAIFHETGNMKQLETKYARYFKSFKNLEQEHHAENDQLLELLKNPVTQKEMLSHLHEINENIKASKKNYDLDENLSHLIHLLSKGEHEQSKQLLLNQLDHWETLGDKASKDIIKNKNNNEFLKTINLELISKTPNAEQPKEINLKSML